jgi:hypothetical protein
MNPSSSFPDRTKIETILSIASYREEYTGGSFETFKSLISRLARAEIVRITYLTNTSIYFQMAMGSSRDRVVELYRYIRSRLRSAYKRLSCIWCVPELVIDIMAFLSKGPEIQIKAEEKEMFVTISNCNGDEEIQIAGEYVGRMAKYSGYKESAIGSSKHARDYANLNLLEQVDPVMFGSRPMPGERRVNFSRECQGTERHPVPVSLEEAEKGISNGSAVIVSNFSYGGPQAYKCIHSNYPYISLRAKSFGTDCTLCCVQQPIPPKSLKAGEQNMCLKSMLFDPTSIEIPSSVASLGAKALQFDGQQLPEGRLATFPSGVRELLPSNVYLYNPPGVDCQNIQEVIQWITSGSALEVDQITGVMKTDGTPCMSCQGATLEDRLMDYIAFGAPIFAIRLLPTSAKHWRASFLDVGGLFEQSPYVMATWAMEIGSPAISFYPVVTKDATPIILDDLNLKVEREVSQESSLLFTYDGISKLGYEIDGMLLRGGICHGLELLDGTKGKGSFFIPIRPARVKIGKIVELEDLTFPTIAQLDALFAKAEKVMPYYSASAKRIFHSGGKTIGLILSPDGVALMFSPSTGIPKHVDAEEAMPIEIAKAALPLLWKRAKSETIPPVLVGTSFSRTTIRSAQIYIASKIVRHKIVTKAEKLLVATDQGSEKEKIAGLAELFRNECKKYVTIGPKIRIPSCGDAMVLLGEKITLPKVIYDSAIYALAAGCPKNKAFLSSYLQCFGAIVYIEKLKLEPWEKMAL